MGLDDVPLFAMLKSKLGYINQREKVISENVANADTPGYAPRDLKPFSFDAAMKSAAASGALVRTNAAHMSSAGRKTASGRSEPNPDSEVRLDGNQVVLEEQMMKMTQARIDYEAAVSLYQQSMSMISTAARVPGK